MTYRQIRSIAYAHSRDPMWISPQGPAPVVRAEGGTLGAFGIFVSRDWVSLRTSSDNEFIVDAKISIYDFNELLDSDLTAESYETLGGFVYAQLDKIPTVGDIPELRTVLLPSESGGPTPYGGKSIGEQPIGAVAPAIVNAVLDATGISITELPVTAEKVYRALHTQ